MRDSPWHERRTPLAQPTQIAETGYYSRFPLSKWTEWATHLVHTATLFSRIDQKVFQDESTFSTLQRSSARPAGNLPHSLNCRSVHPDDLVFGTTVRTVEALGLKALHRPTMPRIDRQSQ
jgi:hypothetical protein